MNCFGKPSRDSGHMSVSKPQHHRLDFVHQVPPVATHLSNTRVFQKYPPVLGIRPLREAIAAKFKRESGLGQGGDPPTSRNRVETLDLTCLV